MLVLGAGGLGSPALLYLAAAGVGRLGVVDPDEVSLSNLQRQVLFDTTRIGQLKTEAACDRLLALYPECTVEARAEAFTSANALTLAADYDLILDGTDNFPSRYLASDTGVWLGKPVIYGSIHRFEGQVSVFAPHLGAPCYRCMFPVPPPPGTVPDCSTAGVLGVLAGLIGTLQAGEAVKLITGAGTPLLGRMLHADMLGTRFREFRLRRDPACPVCGENPSITEPVDYAFFCGVAPVEPDLEMPAARLADIRRTHFILDVREPWEHALLPFTADRWIPWQEVGAQLESLPMDRPILTVCRIGLRSQETARLLRHRGHPSAASLHGGLDALHTEA
ncbi:MAG: Molybdenum cofactor biosynthesis protein MoeB [Verrucomicrobiales bacterium]|nr:Molybdenum cofactor biosynthesis protein MoeB [Verrucomicrobiales bacterium]